MVTDGFRYHLGSRHLPRESEILRGDRRRNKPAPAPPPHPTRNLCFAAKRLPPPLIAIARASMIGGMSVVMDLKDVEKEVVSDPLTMDFMWAVAQTAARKDDSNATEKAKQATAEASYMMNCWEDQAYERVF